ncbi:MAG: GtrA family protein [Candidatus Pacearchaeota archaeon]
MRILGKFFSFCVVGALAALVEMAVFNVVFFLGGVFVLSKIIGIFGGLCFNFFTNRKYTFLDSSGLIKKQVPKFLVVYGVAFVVNLSVSSLVNYLLPGGSLYANVAAASGIVAQIPISFFGSLKWTFRKNQTE